MISLLKKNDPQKSDPPTILRNSLKVKVEAIANDTAQGRGCISAEQASELDRLAKLVEIADKVKPERRDRRIAIILLAIVLVIGLSLMLYRKEKTEVSLDLKLSAVLFTSSKKQPVLPGLGNLSKIDLNGFRLVEVGGDPVDSGTDLVSVASAEAGNQKGKLRLGNVISPEETQVGFRATETTNERKISFTIPQNQQIKLVIDVDGPITIQSPSLKTQPRNFGSPSQFVFISNSNEMDLYLTFLSTINGVQLKQIAITDLNLFSADRVISPDFDYSKQVSSIIAGNIYYGELNEQAVTLRSGERLRFEEVQGDLNSLVIKDEGIDLKFQGHVKGMSTGSLEYPRKLMPTMLEWLKAQQGVLLLWSAIVYFSLLLFSIARWWGWKI